MLLSNYSNGQRRRPAPGLAAPALVTLAALAAAYSLRWLPLPGVAAAVFDAHRSLDASVANAGAGGLWLGSLSIGFLLAELISFLLPAARWRRGGLAGRARIQGIALGLSLASVVLRSYLLATSLEPMTTLAGLPAVNHPGLAFRLGVIATFTGATALLYLLGIAISAHGLGNGFCWLYVLDSATSWVSASRAPLQASTEPTALLFGALWSVPVIALLIRLLRRAPRAAVTRPDGNTLRIRLPELPQGILPDLLIVLLVLPLARLGGRLHIVPTPIHNAIYAGACGAILIPLLSLATFHLAGSSGRLSSNLAPVAAPAARVSAILGRQLRSTTAALVVAYGLVAFGYLLGPAALPLRLTAFAYATAFALDLRDELRFRVAHGARTGSLQLDNLHLGLYLAALLEARGIAALPRAHRIRGLLYFFAPLVKVHLLVPADRAAEAAEIVAAEAIVAF